MSYTVPTVSSSVSFADWTTSQWNAETMWGYIITWYSSAFGTGIYATSLFVGSIMLIIFGVQAIRQESLLLPGAIVATIGASTTFYGAVPQDMQAFFLVIFVVLPVVGVCYDIYRKR
jgi:hypothetical protein